MRRLVLALTAALALALACAGTGAPPPDAASAARVLVQAGTLAWIGQDPTRARQVLDVVDRATGQAEAGPVTIAELRALVPWDRLSVDDRRVLEPLTEAIALELMRRQDLQGAVPLGQLSEVLGWVREAAQAAAPPGP